MITRNYAQHVRRAGTLIGALWFVADSDPRTGHHIDHALRLISRNAFARVRQVSNLPHRHLLQTFTVDVRAEARNVQQQLTDYAQQQDSNNERTTKLQTTKIKQKQRQNIRTNEKIHTPTQ